MMNDEKAKAYDMALEAARKELGVDRKEWEVVEHVLRNIFPELRESEEERIRQGLLKIFKQSPNGYWAGMEIKDIVAYLEKQEQKQTDLPAGFYYIDLDGNKYYSKEFRYGDFKMKIAEPKPAWSEFDKGVLKDAICAADILGNDESFNKGNPNLGKAFRIAKDWLKSLPERFNLQPKQEWSEEDERMRNRLIYDIEHHKKEGLIYAKQNKATKALCDGIEKCYDEKIAWLKSLHPIVNANSEKVNVNWSEEDEKMRLEAIRVLVSGCERYRRESGCLPTWHETIDWLKSLRPQWKPTEEQMEALKETLETYKGFEEYDAMKSLYEQLKKLM